MKINLPLKIEIPNTQAEFDLGLMFRESLEQDTGMLFAFAEDGEHSFHMRHTTIPLDIAFVTEEGVIESIKQLEPLRSSPVYPEGNIRYALEVNRGWFVENNIDVGYNIFVDDWRNDYKPTEIESIDLIKPEPLVGVLDESTRIPTEIGNLIDVYLAWRGRNYMIKMFFPQVSKPSKKEVITQVSKVYPGCKVWNYERTDYVPGQPFLRIGT
tara:strand:+ start:2983 stop:3618 length:636 start_codon:yes stop_codon:yes gene_type:complete